jgi:hypothetical protein
MSEVPRLVIAKTVKPTKRQLPTQIFLNHTQMHLALSIEKSKNSNITGTVTSKRHERHIKRWPKKSLDEESDETLIICWRGNHHHQ